MLTQNPTTAHLSRRVVGRDPRVKLDKRVWEWSCGHRLAQLNSECRCFVQEHTITGQAEDRKQAAYSLRGNIFHGQEGGHVELCGGFDHGSVSSKGGRQAHEQQCIHRRQRGGVHACTG